MSMAYALSLAPVGARCMLRGLRDWVREADGWRNTETGEVLDSAGLAARESDGSGNGGAK